MELPSDMQASELFGAQAHIWNHIFNFINSMSLKCAIQLGIPDVINNHGGPMTLSNLIEALQIKEARANSVERLMRILVHSGFFIKKKFSKNEKEEEGYLLGPASRLLLKDDPLSVAPFLLAMLDPILMNPWHFLSKWFKNGEAMIPFEMAHGTNLWDLAGKNQELNDSFNNAMASDSRLISGMVIKECKGVFEGVDSLVDVGGGTGTMAKAIADAFPHMKCTSFDLPHVVANLEGSKNLRFVPGDAFKEIPPADAVLLKWKLHDCDDEECVKILKRAKEAVIRSKGKGGKVIIIEMVVDNQNLDCKSAETQLFFDMLMMVCTTGKEKNEKDWGKLFSDAGFSDYKITPILGLRSLIEVYP